MDKDRIRRQVKAKIEAKGILRLKERGSPIFFFALTFTCLLSCSSTEMKRDIQIPRESKETTESIPAQIEQWIPDFVPVTEDISPLKTRIIDIVAINESLRNVLHVIAEATGLNLVMEKDVTPDIPITLTLKNVSAEDALNTIFSSVDYFYTIKDNMLVVKAMDTRIFELGHPAIVQTYNVDIGGDILGGAMGATASSNIKGNITQSVKGDTVAFGFWDAIEKSIAGILGATTGQTTGVQQSFTVNRLTGTVVVTASKKSIERAEQYINTIKSVINRQVLIEAKIIEVQLSEGLKYGIDWNFISKWGRGNNAGNINLNTQRFTTVVPSSVPAFGAGVASTFNIGTVPISFDAILNALRQQGEVRTLSNPRVNIMNGQTALLSVGRNESFLSKVETVTTATGGTTATTSYTTETSSILSGIIIGIVPYINENGEISLTITPIISELLNLESKIFGKGTTNEVEIQLPTVDLREMSTTVKVRDGQMVIIGGLIQKKETLRDNKIPLLGDIPVLGKLFTSREKTENKTELVIVLQPVLVSK